MGGGGIGFFGKLPSHGDFIRRHLPDAFVNVWDEWLQGCIAESRARLDKAWLDVYLTSPVWRFVLCDGVAGAATFTGVVVPSVDRVGRYFPLTIAAELSATSPPVSITIRGRQWFRTVETLALEALEAQEFDLDRFDAALQSSGAELHGVEEHAGVALEADFPNAERQWRLPVESSERVAAALIDPLMAAVARNLRPMSLWWTDGSEHVRPSCLLMRLLPDPARFTAMLDGRWQDAGWSGEPGDPALESSASPAFRYQLASGGISEAGPVRTVNQDSFLDRADLALWAVADGLGGHSHGERASRMVVDALASLQPAATVSAALGAAMTALTRVNEELCRAAAGPGDRSGSTVVALTVGQGEWGVLWAGDSRAYVLRSGALVPLTRDHSAGAGEASAPDSQSPQPPSSTGVVTRAVGAEETLLLEQESGALTPGDRFLLCSDGVHGKLSHAAIIAVLEGNRDPIRAAEALLAAATAAGTSDNITAVVVDIVGAAQ
jgi:type VI secretion system protein ImpM